MKGSSRKFLRLTASAAAINAALYENLDFPAKTVPKFIAYAKANPGVINFGPGVSAEIDVLFADLAPNPTPRGYSTEDGAGNRNPPWRPLGPQRSSPSVWKCPGWQPLEDSNLDMSNSKSPFEMSPEFAPISEQIATEDFSRRS